MKKALLVSVFITTLFFSKAQEAIKVGDERTITCTGTFMAQVQNYFLNGTPSSVSKSFMDVQNDSLVFFTALINAGREKQAVIKYTVAKKDLDTGDWGIEVDKTKENGADFLLLKIKTTEGKSVVSEVMYKNDKEEISDPTNRVHIYFLADKEADAKSWAEKIKKAIQ
ncbi:MAG: hypothetical protein JNM14_01560 [Ferruginibacter sp.]|nr:hypothetical protein [Ferruginibacter sp.]